MQNGSPALLFDASLQLLSQLVRVAGTGPTWCLRREGFCISSSLGGGSARESGAALPGAPMASLARSVGGCSLLTRCAPSPRAGSAHMFFSRHDAPVFRFLLQYPFLSWCRVDPTLSFFFLTPTLGGPFKYSSQSSAHCSDSGETP